MTMGALMMGNLLQAFLVFFFGGGLNTKHVSFRLFLLVLRGGRRWFHWCLFFAFDWKCVVRATHFTVNMIDYEGNTV